MVVPTATAKPLPTAGLASGSLRNQWVRGRRAQGTLQAMARDCCRPCHARYAANFVENGMLQIMSLFEWRVLTRLSSPYLCKILAGENQHVTNHEMYV